MSLILDLVQAIRSYIRDKEPEELLQDMGTGADGVSGVRERLPGWGMPPNWSRNKPDSG